MLQPTNRADREITETLDADINLAEVSGAAIGAANPVPAAPIVAGAAVSSTNRFPVTSTGSSVTVSQTPTITAGAYAAGKAVGGKLTFANMAREAGGVVTLQSVTILDKAAQSAHLVLVLFDRDFTATADNAAFDPSDADLAHVVAIVPVFTSDYQEFADNAAATASNLGIVVTLNGTSLYGQMMCVGAPTYVSTSDLTVIVSGYQD